MESIALAVAGIVFIVIGVLNRKGIVSMIHSYHRKRVSEEDKLAFAKLVGVGMLIIGFSLIIASAFNFVYTLLYENLYLIIGYAVSIAGVVIGVGISFYAMIKYNKGIF